MNTPITDLVEAAHELGYAVDSVSLRHITLVAQFTRGHHTEITVISTELSPELVKRLVKSAKEEDS